MKNRLHSIIKKCELSYGTWGGYLQPAEIIMLVESGLIQPNQFGFTLKEWIRVKDRGTSNPQWFYFTPKPKFLELHRGLKY
jgi:hypothetical protein